MRQRVIHLCEECASPIGRRGRSDRRTLCLEHGIERSAENAKRAQAARGLPRDQWLAVMRGEAPAPPFQRPLTLQLLEDSITYRRPGLRRYAEV